MSLPRTLCALAALAALASLTACGDRKPPPVSSRFEGVEAPSGTDQGFCEKRYPASGPGVRKYQAPPLRGISSAMMKSSPVSAPQPTTGWTWINLWATWCEPCRDEMPLLARWQSALGREGTPIKLELLSVDAPENQEALTEAITRGLPGHLSWLRDEEALPPYLESTLGVKRDDALPIHALVDEKGNLRCVRVGAIHESDYGAIKALLSDR